MNFKIAYCFKEGSICKYKGATLIIQDNSYTIKFAFKTLDILNKTTTTATKIPNYMFLFRGVNLTNGTNSYNLYFNDCEADKIYQYLNL